VSISYSFSDATPAIWLTQSASPGYWPKGAEWDRVECSGQQLFVLKKDSPEAWIHLDRDGTAVRIQSKFDRERLFQMAASLVPAPTRQPPLTSQG